MTVQSMPINTMKLIPTNNQKTEVNTSFLMPNRIVINTNILAPTNIQKKFINVISLSSSFLIVPKIFYEDYPFKTCGINESAWIHREVLSRYSEHQFWGFQLY